MKICSRNSCLLVGQKQLLENFAKDGHRKDGLRVSCKVCDKALRRKYYLKNREDLIQEQKDFYQQNKEKIKSQARVRHHKNKEKNNMFAKKWKEGHKEEVKIYNKQYKKQHRKELNQYANQKHNEDINVKLANNLRNRLRDALKNDFKSGSAVADLCCSISDFKLWLEEQFYSNPKTGEAMSWDNYGKLWHIDHILPLSSVVLSDRVQLKKVCHWFNLRPRWAYQNISESDRGMSRNKKNVT